VVREGWGLIIARYLIENYQAKVILLGRSKLNTKQQSLIDKLKSINSEIIYLQADVTKYEDMKEVMNK